MIRLLVSASALAFAAAGAASAETDWTAKAREIHAAAIGIPSVSGSPAVLDCAKYLAGVLRKGGFEVEVDASGPAPTLVATLRGTTRAAPILLLGHMDVVPAERRDWTHDPFAAIEKDGMVVGRGAVDNKFDVAVLTATMLRLKAEGFAPARDVVLVLSGDEEVSGASTARLAERFRGALFALNGDGGGGELDASGAPLSFSLQAAEKTYADFELAALDAGGHSSRPTPTNAIYRLARALDRVAAIEFPTQANEVTRAWFRATGAKTGGAKGAAMIRFADDPDDRKAVRLLRSDIDCANKMATTCVATMLSGGHAANALPQRATANVNCRIFPGVDPKDVAATLEKAIGDPSVTVKRVDTASASDASPLRDDVVGAVRKAVEAVHPGAPVTPGMSAGATDSVFFRAAGVPSYGVSGLWMRAEDDFSHGLDERVPVAAFAPAMTHYYVLLKDVAAR